jgi:hypothetical protein
LKQETQDAAQRSLDTLLVCASGCISMVFAVIFLALLDRALKASKILLPDSRSSSFLVSALQRARTRSRVRF